MHVQDELHTQLFQVTVHSSNVIEMECWRKIINDVEIITRVESYIFFKYIDECSFNNCIIILNGNV